MNKEDFNQGSNRRMPPKKHRFRKGVSGNPRGRPRKPQRAHIPSQIGKDVRRVSEILVTIRTAKGEEVLTAAEAAIYSLVMGAIKGKAAFMKLWLDLYRRALVENLKQHPDFDLVDGVPSLRRNQGKEMNVGAKNFVDMIAKMSRKT